MKLLHTSDWHLSPKPAKLRESVRCAAAIVTAAHQRRPDVATIAGDLWDFHDGSIRIDSETARAGIRLIQDLAEVCPVLVIRGTPSHDREGVEFLRDIKTRHPIYVGTQFEQVGLLGLGRGSRWVPLQEVIEDGFAVSDLHAVFTLLPSVEKAWLMARGFTSIREANAGARELLFDLLSGFGQVNDSLPGAPKILVGHGMTTGARLSSGITTLGEDLEWGTTELRAAKCDVVCLGHVHAAQNFGADIWYSGSPGRNDFGETEEKGFLLVDVEPGQPPAVEFVLTPARRFVTEEIPWNGGGVEAVRAAIAGLSLRPDVAGADVRFRFAVPEEHLHEIDQEALRSVLELAGAREVKIERSILPKERTRASGVSECTTLAAKLARWGETVGVELPQDVLELAGRIEGLEAEEVAAEILALLDRPAADVEPIPLVPEASGSAVPYRERVRSAIEGFGQAQEVPGDSRQPDLFGGVL